MDETKIIRGFFKAVQAGGGEVVGYKRYPTQEQLLNPVAEVGTYRAGDLRSGPGPSVPRDCATRYNQARQGLLQQPGAVEAWTEFADLCDALQRALEEYRNKPGSEPSGPLSFESEGRFARRLATGPGVAQIKQVVGP